MRNPTAKWECLRYSALTVAEAASNILFRLFIDLVVLVNVILVGWEVDHGGEGLQVPCICLCSIYGLEICLRFLNFVVFGEFQWRRLKFWSRIALEVFDLTILVLMVIDVAQGQYSWFWRSSLLRMLRYLRIYRTAERWTILNDLWIVLVGLARARRALAWLALLLLIVLYASGAVALGLVEANWRHEDGSVPDCSGQNLRECFNAYEYFGSLSRSSLTMLQLSTLDAWASHVIRPLLISKPFAAVVLTVCALMTAYGLLSVAVGVLVWSTVALARTRGDHAAIKAAKEDAEIIESLGKHFDDMLAAEMRSTMEFMDLQDAMLMPWVVKGLKDLDLPVRDIAELFQHLDRRRAGEISVEDFVEGLRIMKNPATRFDIACLSATIGGTVTFTGRAINRASGICQSISALNATLESAFAEVEKLHLPGGKMSEAPEALLRKAGYIENAEPPLTPRYS